MRNRNVVPPTIAHSHSAFTPTKPQGFGEAIRGAVIWGILFGVATFCFALFIGFSGSERITVLGFLATVGKSLLVFAATVVLVTIIAWAFYEGIVRSTWFASTTSDPVSFDPFVAKEIVRDRPVLMNPLGYGRQRQVREETYEGQGDDEQDEGITFANFIRMCQYGTSDERLEPVVGDADLLDQWRDILIDRGCASWRAKNGSKKAGWKLDAPADEIIRTLGLEEDSNNQVIDWVMKG